MQKFELFTVNYPRFQPAMGTPIQASNGRPRYALKYDLTLSCREVYPPWALVRGDHSEEHFRREYQAHLDTIGLDTFASRFRALATASGDERLVLLCFEDLSKPGWWCHRRHFADWWKRLTGEEVRELGPTGPPAPVDNTLF